MAVKKQTIKIKYLVELFSDTETNLNRLTGLSKKEAYERTIYIKALRDMKYIILRHQNESPTPPNK